MNQRASSRGLYVVMGLLLLVAMILPGGALLPSWAMAQGTTYRLASHGIRVQSDIPYAAPWSAGQTQKLDLYDSALLDDAAISMGITEPHDGRARPVVVFLHGGSWAYNDKTMLGGHIDRTPLVSTLVQAGYIVASVDYRLTSESPWPAQINDCKSAVRYLRANASRYGIDSERIAVFGESAGAHLAMMLGVTNGTSRFVDMTDGNGDVSSDVQAVISDYGIADVNEWGHLPNDKVSTVAHAKALLLGSSYTADEALQASPVTYATANAAPMFLVHGKNDTTVSYEQSMLMERTLKRVGASVSTWYPDEGEHSSFDVFVRNIVAEKKYLDFLSSVMPERLASAAKKVAVHHFYNPSIDSHVFTADTNEMVVLNQYWSGWRNEGGSFAVFDDAKNGTETIYRLHDSERHDYLYTMDASEISRAQDDGWTVENTYTFYAPGNGSVPVYRLYDSTNESHTLTTDIKQRNSLMNLGWRYEGIAFYAMPYSSVMK